MGIKSMIRFCYVTLAVILISTNASAMISGEEDYQRADTLHRLADKVYSLGIWMPYENMFIDCVVACCGLSPL